MYITDQCHYAEQICQYMACFLGFVCKIIVQMENLLVNIIKTKKNYLKQLTNETKISTIQYKICNI